MNVTVFNIYHIYFKMQVTPYEQAVYVGREADRIGHVYVDLECILQGSEGFISVQEAVNMGLTSNA